MSTRFGSFETLAALVSAIVLADSRRENTVDGRGIWEQVLWVFDFTESGERAEAFRIADVTPEQFENIGRLQLIRHINEIVGNFEGLDANQQEAQRSTYVSNLLGKLETLARRFRANNIERDLVISRVATVIAWTPVSSMRGRTSLGR